MKSILIISTFMVIVLMGCRENPEEPATLVRTWKLSRIEQGSTVVTEGLGFFELQLKADNNYNRVDVDGLMTFGRWAEANGRLILTNDLLLMETEFQIEQLTSTDMTLFFDLNSPKTGQVETRYFLIAKQ